jgi:hypothetical protein
MKRLVGWASVPALLCRAVNVGCAPRPIFEFILLIQVSMLAGPNHCFFPARQTHGPYKTTPAITAPVEAGFKPAPRVPDWQRRQILPLDRGQITVYNANCL